MTKPPAFQFYAADFKLDTEALSADAVGVYVRLLCSAWVNGSIPNDPGELARIGGVELREFRKIWPRIEGNWDSDGNGSLTNGRQELERAKQKRWREKSAKGGKAAAQAKADQ